jgi:hypothetical protein
MFPCPCDYHRGKAVSRATRYRCNKKRKENPDQPDSESQTEDDSEKESDTEKEEDPGLGCPQARSFACQMVEQVVRGRVTQKGVTDILKIFQQHYGRLLPSDIKMPRSWYMVRKLASKGEVQPCDMRDVCPKCDWIFPRTTDPTCVRCGVETRWHDRKVGEPVRQAAYFDVAYGFQKFFEVGRVFHLSLNSRHVYICV